MQNVMQIATNAGHTAQNDGRTAQNDGRTAQNDGRTAQNDGRNTLNEPFPYLCCMYNKIKLKLICIYHLWNFFSRRKIIFHDIAFSFKNLPPKKFCEKTGSPSLDLTI